MISIGLIGESPNDTIAIKHLLQQKFNEGFRYKLLLKNITGDHLNLPKAKRAITIEIKNNNPDIVIVIRDADVIETNTDQIALRWKWYNNFAADIKKPKLLLLNIYELEALIFADIEKFNSRYNTSISGNRKVTFIDKPKEELRNKTGEKRKYVESDCPVIFKEIRIDVVSKNCPYFSDFLIELSRILDEKKLNDRN